MGKGSGGAGVHFDGEFGVDVQSVGLLCSVAMGLDINEVSSRLWDVLLISHHHFKRSQLSGS